MASAFIRNRCFTQRTKETPFYMLTGIRSGVSKLHIFGTLCYPYIEEYKKKLGARCSEGIFVGYDKSSPSYLVYHPISDTVKRYRVVKFTEKFENIPKQRINVTSDYEELEDNSLQNIENNVIMPNVRRGEQPYKDEDLEVNDEVVNLSLQDIHNNDINISDTANIQHDEDRVIHSSIDEVEVGIQKLNSSGRRTFRSRKSPDYLKDYVCTHHVDFTYTIKDSPRTYDDAINSDDSCEWKEAMECEMRSLIENDTFTTVHLPKDRKIVGGRWVYALKTDPLVNTVHKARYVAKGYSQEHGSDYFDTFSPTAKITSIRIMIQVAAE